MATLAEFFKQQPPGRIAAIGGSMLATIGFFAYIMLRASTPNMGLLFSQIDPSDGGRVIERLRAMNIPVEIRGDGTHIYVPEEDVARLRMELAHDGMPSGGSVGYELFDKGDVLGTTTALMDLNYMRALEGELSKSIRTIQGVQSARVHLVVPKKELFNAERAQASASVIIKLKAGSRLSATQTQSVQYLLASSVPGLTADKISIIDDKGTMLAKGSEGGELNGGFSLQEDIKRNVEERLSRTLEGLLEKTLGDGKARVEVSADIDFDKMTQTSVEFNPDGTVARNTSSTQEGNNSNESGSQSDVVSIQTALPDQNNASGSSQNKSQSSRSEEQTTFEISNKTTTLVKESGGIKRLSVAVLVDGMYKKDPSSKETYTARTPEEIEQLTTLVKTAVGYREDRGDSVKVINMPFSAPPVVDEHKESSFLSSLNINKIIEITLLGTFGLLIGLLVLKPLFSSLYDRIGTTTVDREDEEIADGGRPRRGNNTQYVMLPQNNVSVMPGAAPSQTVAPIPGKTEYQFYQPENTTTFMPPPPTGVNPYLQAMLDMDNIEDRVKDSSGKKIGEIIEKHPDEAVSILRGWIYGGDKK